MVLMRAKEFDDLWVKADSFSIFTKAVLLPMKMESIVRSTRQQWTEQRLILSHGSEPIPNRTYTITLYEGNPDLGGTAVCMEDVVSSKVVDQIKANANKVNSVRRALLS